MLDKIQEYMSNKWVMSTLFVGEDYIERTSKENEWFRNEFFSEQSLNYVLYLLNNEHHMKILDKDKKVSLKQALNYYLKEYPNVDGQKKQIIYSILDKLEKTTIRNTNKFYKLQYEIRNEKKCRKTTPELKMEIDAAIINDSTYLIDISKAFNNEFPNFYVNDIDFLKSLMIFIEECPEMTKISAIDSYIQAVLKLNKMYTDPELKRLNDSLIEYFDEKKEREYKLHHEIMKQSIFSLIYNENIREILKETKENPAASILFDKNIFEMVKELIEKNKQTCMFDKNIIENVRELVFAFYDMKVITNQELNDIKKELNIYMDEEYNNENKKFYIDMFYEYNSKEMKITNFYDFKKTVNAFISNTENILSSIIDFEIDSSTLAQDQFISLYINYILNNYPLVREEIVYIDRIKDILNANLEYMDNSEEMDLVCLANNDKLQKKIKKLQK